MTRENDKLYTLDEVWTGYQKFLEEKKLGDPSKITSFFQFPDGYIPKLQFITQPSGKRDVFIDTIEKTFDVDGARVIRYIPMYANGMCYDRDPETDEVVTEDVQIRQLFPNSYIARVSCTMRGLTPDNLILDYVLNTVFITLEGVADANSNTMTVIRTIDMTMDYHHPVSGDTVYFDPMIHQFLGNRNKIFELYFAPRFVKEKRDDR